MGRVTIERDVSAAGRDADIRTYPVKAGEAIQAGDVVDVVGGEVWKPWRGVANEKTVISAKTATNISVCKLTNEISAVGYVSAGVGYMGRLSVSAAGIKSIGQYLFSDVAPTNISCVRMSDTQFAVAFVSDNAYRIKIGTISENALVFNNEAVINNIPGSSGQHTTVQLSASQFLSLYNYNSLTARVVTTIGTGTSATVRVASPYECAGATSSVSYISACRLPDLNGNKRVCVCYSDAADGNKGKAVIATIKPDNSVEWGAPVVFSEVACYRPACCTDGEYVIVAYTTETRRISSLVMSCNGAVITPSPGIDIGPGGDSIISVVMVGKIAVLSYGNGYVSPYQANSVVLCRTNNSLTKGSIYQFNSARGYYISSAQVSETQLIVVYDDYANSNYGTATLLEVRGDQIAGGFEDVSSQAIALQDGTGGQRIDVIFDGTAELLGITAGARITSAGVQGYSPQDGWVWVRPEWDRTTEVGSYIGTGVAGEANKSSITFDFAPKMVIITTDTEHDPSGSNRNKMLIWIGQTGTLLHFQLDGTTLSWWFSNTGNHDVQFNLAGVKYRYIAIK